MMWFHNCFIQASSSARSLALASRRCLLTNLPRQEAKRARSELEPKTDTLKGV